MLTQFSVPAREMQREYKAVFSRANKYKKPVVVFAHSKPIGAVIGLDLLEKLQLDMALREALTEYKNGETQSITSKNELDRYFEELEKAI